MRLAGQPPDQSFWLPLAAGQSRPQIPTPKSVTDAPTWMRARNAQPQRKGPGGDVQEWELSSHLGESRTCPGD